MFVLPLLKMAKKEGRKKGRKNRGKEGWGKKRKFLQIA